MMSFVPIAVLLACAAAQPQAATRWAPSTSLKGYDPEDLHPSQANCGSCKVAANFNAGESITFNPRCLSGEESFGCVTHTQTGQKNGCQICESGPFQSVPCATPVCRVGILPADFETFCRAFVKVDQPNQQVLWDPDCLDGGHGCIEGISQVTGKMKFNGCKYCGGASYEPCEDANRDGLDDDWATDDDPRSEHTWTSFEREQQQARESLTRRIKFPWSRKSTPGNRRIGAASINPLSAAISMGNSGARLYGATNTMQHPQCQALVTPGTLEQVMYDPNCLSRGRLMNGCISENGRFNGCKYCGFKDYEPCDLNLGGRRLIASERRELASFGRDNWGQVNDFSSNADFSRNWNFGRRLLMDGERRELAAFSMVGPGGNVMSSSFGMGPGGFSSYSGPSSRAGHGAGPARARNAMSASVGRRLLASFGRDNNGQVNDFSTNNDFSRNRFFNGRRMLMDGERRELASFGRDNYGQVNDFSSNADFSRNWNFGRRRLLMDGERRNLKIDFNMGEWTQSIGGAYEQQVINAAHIRAAANERMRAAGLLG